MGDVGAAWAAGFYEGEGSVGVARYPRSHTIRIQVRQSSKTEEPPEVLTRMREILGEGKVYGPYHQGKYPTFSLNITGFPAVERILGRLWPYLGPVKREQAIRVFEECDRALPVNYP